MSETSDQTVLDTVSVIMGALILFAVAIGIVAFVISGRTVEESRLDDPTVRADLVARIAPVGSALLVGEDARPAPAPAPTPAPVEVAQARGGEEVYNLACIACHGAGIAGAPKVGDAEAWVARIAQGLEILSEHAINGYAGSAGYMPAKGGNPTLSDEEVVASIEYMLEQSQ